MKYHIDTIPLWDSVKEDSECPFCLLERKTEQQTVEGFLGGSLMESDYRVETNDKGFCTRHFHMLYDGGNRLGTALMTHTHMRELERRLEKRYEPILAAEGKRAKKDCDAALTELSSFLGSSIASCAVCDRIDYDMKRYAGGFLQLWVKDDSMKELFAASKGVCISHLKLLIDVSFEALSAAERKDFFNALLPIEKAAITRMDGELRWFTEKFDYRNNDKPWGNSKDALVRCLLKLTGDNYNE